MRDIIYFDENLSVEEYVKKKYVKWWNSEYCLKKGACFFM